MDSLTPSLTGSEIHTKETNTKLDSREPDGSLNSFKDLSSVLASSKD
jgi:hypothetical protein